MPLNFRSQAAKAQLREALADEHAQAGAADIIRKLVDNVVLTPVADEEGRKSLTIDLHGHLAGILSLATKAKRPLGESGLPVEYTKLVAGARNTRFLRSVENIPRLAASRKTSFCHGRE